MAVAEVRTAAEALMAVAARTLAADRMVEVAAVATIVVSRESRTALMISQATLLPGNRDASSEAFPVSPGALLLLRLPHSSRAVARRVGLHFKHKVGQCASLQPDSPLFAGAHSQLASLNFCAHFSQQTCV